MIIGIDAHKRVLQAVAIDAQGREQASWRGANTPAAWAELRPWAEGLASQRTWGIEGAGQYGRGLAQDLLAAGETVLEVNPRQTAAMRRGSRRRDKSDRLDALAIARGVVRDGAELPRVAAEDATAVVAVLVAEREQAVAEATRLRNQLHELLLQLSFVDARPWPDLTAAAAVATLIDYQAPASDPLVQARAASVRRLATRLALALEQAAALGQEIAELARAPFAPLTTLVGVAPLMAGMLAAHLGCGQRFATDAQVAKHAGVAPLETSSGAHPRHRLNRTGDRQLNALFHRIALVQSRCYPPAQAYLARRQAEGKTKKEALRALTRYIARAVFHRWQQCFPLPPLTALT
jgi:transposase